MSELFKKVLLERTRFEQPGRVLPGRADASLGKYSVFITALREMADTGPSASVRGKIAAILVDTHDHLEQLPDREAFNKVSELSQDASYQIQNAIAERQLLNPFPGSTWDYYRMPKKGIGYSPTLYHMGHIARYWDNNLFGIPNRPGPLSSMLVLGTLGALAGRGGAWAADKVQGKKNNFRRNLWTALGGAAGMIPGLAYAGLNSLSGEPTWTGAALNTPIRNKESKQLPVDLAKYSGAFTPQQMRDMLEDPYVANRLPPLIAPATMGLVEGAQNLPGRRSDLPIVTPGDIAQMAIGMGSGYFSGMVVGKALGGLLGVSDSTQQVLRRSGAAAGLLKSVVPLAFGQ